LTNASGRVNVLAMERGPSAWLVCVGGSLVGRSFQVTPAGLRLGRDPANEVVIEDVGVSRQHARVILHNGAVWVQDAGSRNGVFVNQQRVPDHRQVKPGERLLVGNSTFEVQISTQPATSVAPASSAGPSAVGGAERRFKALPFVIAVVVVVLGILAVALGSGRSGARGAAPPASAGSPAYSLSSAIGGPGDESKAPAQAPSVQQALAMAAGADAESQRARLPDAPPGVTVPQLMERAQGMMDSGRLADARTHYQMALKGDPACELCRLRIAKLEADIARKAQEQLDAGVRAFDTMQYASAATAFETVLLLVPDTADPMHVRAREGLSRARAGGRP
jgi:hypothetical protein